MLQVVGDEAYVVKVMLDEIEDAAERQILAIPFSQFRDSALAGALFHQKAP